MLVDLDLARNFARLREAAIITKTAPPAMVAMMAACEGRRGRRPLTQIEREAREQGLVPSTSDERHRKRVASAARSERAIREWGQKHGSLLGAASQSGGEPGTRFPKKRPN
jgi:hypothetical protein